MFFGVLMDGLAIFFGGLVGLFLNKGISKRFEDAIMKAIAISAIYIAISGMSSGENMILIILSIVFGVLIGEWINFDDKINRLINAVSAKLSNPDKPSMLTEGFITGSLMMGVGALSILGPLQSGLTGDHTIMLTNAVIDGVTSLLLASSLGLGVVLSAFSVFAYKASIVLFAGYLDGILTNAMINDMGAIGGLIVLMIGLNLLELTDFKVMNFVPAIFIPMFLFFLYI